jgi:hypothetical protein
MEKYADNATYVMRENAHMHHDWPTHWSPFGLFLIVIESVVDVVAQSESSKCRNQINH